MRGWGCAWSGDRRLVVGILAILKAGGAYVPLDPSYPTERLQRAGAGCRAGARRSCDAAGRQALGRELGDETRLVALDDDGDERRRSATDAIREVTG